jgi:hypothetical protein
MMKLATENEILTGLETNVVPLVTAIDGDPGGEGVGGGDGGGCEGGLLEGGVWVVDAPPSELSLLHAATLSSKRARSMHTIKCDRLRMISIVCRKCTEPVPG